MGFVAAWSALSTLPGPVQRRVANSTMLILFTVPPFRGLPEGSRGPAAIVFCWGGLTARPAPPSEACSRPPLSCFCSVFRPIYRCPLPAVISLFPVYPMRCRGACRASTLCSPLVLSGCRDTQEGWGITFNELCGYYTTIIGIVKKNFTSFFT